MNDEPDHRALHHYAGLNCLDAFRLAFLTQFPLWALGWAFIVIERRKTRVLLGIDTPRRSR